MNIYYNIYIIENQISKPKGITNADTKKEM